MQKYIKIACLFLYLITSSTVFGAPSNEAEQKAASEAFYSALKAGPTDIIISDQATIHLPNGYGFVGTPQSKNLLEAMGNRVSEDHQGLIVPTSNDSNWFVSVSFIKAGYVKDDDAKSWDASKLLKNISDGTEETNKLRKEKGIPEMEIVGWIEQPKYDESNRRLVWSIASRDKGGQNSVQGVNYNTLALGRDGYISMNMVAGRNEIEALKPTAKELLASLDYNTGKKYADFNESTDKVAAYGLAAIVAGVAAKKIGMFAIIAGFAAKFAKLFIIGGAALFGGFFNRFRKKQKSALDSANISKPD